MLYTARGQELFDKHYDTVEKHVRERYQKMTKQAADKTATETVEKAAKQSVAGSMGRRGLPIRKRSDCYNPFIYIREESDVVKLVTNLMKNTMLKGSNPSDPFWEHAEGMFLQSLFYYVWLEERPERRNFSSVLKLMTQAEVMRALAARVPKEVILSYFYPICQWRG